MNSAFRARPRQGSPAPTAAAVGSGTGPYTSDAERLVAIRAGDEAAFESLFREQYQGLCAFAARRVGSDHVAEEVVQTVLLRLWQHRAEVQISGPVAGYLYGAVRKAALMHLRRANLEQRWRTAATPEMAASLTGEPCPPPDARIRAAEMIEAIERVVEKLPPRCQEAYLLRREHHLSYAEIAQVMGISRKTVEVQIGAALRALRRALADW